MAKERKKDEGAEMEREGEERREGKVKERDRESAPRP